MFSETFLPLSRQRMGDEHQPQHWKSKEQRGGENKLLFGISVADTYSQP